jgi:ParB family chromosome partitioning protein
MDTFEENGKTFARLIDLSYWEKNPRRILPKDLERVKKQLVELGQYKPLICTNAGIVIGGNSRYKAMLKLGWEKAWVSVVEADDDAVKTKYALSDNDAAGRYIEEEVLDLSKLIADKVDLSLFNVDFGKSINLENLLDKHKFTEDDDLSELEAVESVQVQTGDVWKLGNHWLICGDSTKPEAYQNMPEMADLIFTDPPYGVSYEEKAKTLGRVGSTNISGDSSIEDAKIVWKGAFEQIDLHLKEGGSYYVCAPQGGDQMMMMMMQGHIPCKHELIWVKNNAVFSMGRLDYSYAHEPILYGWKEGTGHKFYGESGDSSVWRFNKPHQSKLHPTQKPIALISKAVKNSSLPNQLVLDPFAGSGSTLIACEKLGRRSYNIELDNHYCGVIIRRWEKMTGRNAEKVA